MRLYRHRCGGHRWHRSTTADHRHGLRWVTSSQAGEEWRRLTLALHHRRRAVDAAEATARATAREHNPVASTASRQPKHGSARKYVVISGPRSTRQHACVVTVVG